MVKNPGKRDLENLTELASFPEEDEEEKVSIKYKHALNVINSL